MKFDDEERLRQQFADWAADALPYHPRSEINRRAWMAWQVATQLERERHRALRDAIEALLAEHRHCTACGCEATEWVRASAQALDAALGTAAPATGTPR